MATRGTGKKAPEAPTEPDGSGKKKVTLHLPIAQARALKVYAAQNDRDMSAIVSELLERAGIK